FVSILSLYIIVGLISFTLANVYISIGLFALVAILTAIVMKQAHAEKFLGILSSIGGLIGGLILFLYHDIHGAAILGGAFTACILLFLQTKTCNCKASFPRLNIFTNQPDIIHSVYII